MATNKANGPMFCQAARLPQSVADRASAPLADGRQNKVQIAQTGHELVIPKRKFRTNTIEELHRKRLKRNISRKNKMRQMTKKEKRALIKSKIVKHPEAAHSQEIRELKNSELDAKRKAVFYWKKLERNTTSITVSQRLLQVVPRLKLFSYNLSLGKTF